jgi:hypothetical protein
MRRLRFPVLAALIILTVVCSCKIVLDSNHSSILKAADFAITDQISSWTMEQGGLASYNDPNSLQLVMDGGFEIYTDNGMIEGIQEKMSTADGRRNQIMVMDFGTPDKASAMYQFQKARLTGRTATFNYPDTTAIGKVTLNGVTVYSHFNHFYVELGMTGYSPASKAIADGNLFLGFYETTANQSTGQ